MVTLSLPGHLDLIKQINAGMVYRLIDRFGPISRIDLSKKSQLAPASITKIVREMLDAQLIKEIALDETFSRGRPAIGLLTDNGGWHYLAVQMTADQLRFALCDFSQCCIAQQSCPLPVDRHAPLMEVIIQAMDAFFIAHQNKLERLTAIAFTLSGIIDTVSGIVHHLPYYSIGKIPLKSTLESHTGLPVYIQTVVAAWTLAEALFGAAQDEQNVIQIMNAENVDVGVITGGKQLHSSNRSSLGLGHIRVVESGEVCYCGNTGCLETFAGISGILSRTELALAAGRSSLLKYEVLSPETLCQAANQWDDLACEMLAQTGEAIGSLVSIMVNLFNPQKILIGSPLNLASSLLFSALNDAIDKRTLPLYHEKMRMLLTHFPLHDLMIPAALVKQELYKGGLLVRLLQG
ncbi:MAG: Protein mlc [Candidatus Erwinia impunctatus]|nr:Protein mlc [Culicoides impunctatus]